MKNYQSATNPKDTVNGIKINGCSVDKGYADNQLVVRADLQLLYMVLDSIAVSGTQSISQCGGDSTICATGTFHLETVSEGGGISKGNSVTDNTITPTWSGDADDSGPSNCTTISFGLNTVNGAGTANPTASAARSESTTASYTYKGTNLTSANDTTKTASITVTQAGNNVGDWYYVASEDYATALSVSCPGTISENGGSATVTSTLSYMQRWKAKDDCGNIVGLKFIAATKSGPSQTVSFAEQDCDEPERCETVSLSLSGQSNSCSVCQEASSVPCYCGENCAGNCNATIHWHCAEKKSYTNMGTTYTISGLDGDGCLPCSGGTATVTIHGTTDTELYTRAAECKTATLPTTMGRTESQTVVGLVQSSTGTTGSSSYYDYKEGKTYYVATNKYTAYTQYHYMAYNTADKYNRDETTYQYDTLGTSYKYEVLTYSFNDYDSYHTQRYYSKSDYVNGGPNDGSDWDDAVNAYYDSYWEDGYYKCSVTGEEVSGPNSTCEDTDESGNTITGTVSWVVTDSGYTRSHPSVVGLVGYYWFTNYTNFSKMDDVMMDSVPDVCYVASISADRIMFYSASTSSNSMVKTFEYGANTTTAATNGSVTFRSDNPSVGNSPNKIETITVNYKVAACTDDTDKYTLASVTGPSSAVACGAVPRKWCHNNS